MRSQRVLLADIELVSDDSAVSLLGKHSNLYDQADLKAVNWSRVMPSSA